jgi:hypothetical protein
MKLLTVLALPSTISNIDRVRDSFDNIDVEFVIIEVGGDFNIAVKTPWKFFIHLDEWLSIDLKESLPIYLEYNNEYQYMSVYRKSNNKVALSPRLFKNEVKMREGCVYPVDPDLSHTIMLDGFLYGDDYD